MIRPEICEEFLGMSDRQANSSDTETGGQSGDNCEGIEQNISIDSFGMKNVQEDEISVESDILASR